MSSFDEELRLDLQARRVQNRYRQRYNMSTPQAVNVTVDQRAYLAFCNNDYLGLANHPASIVSMQQVAAQYGVGSGASHLVYGHSKIHHRLEKALAAFTDRERALLFSTGYMANLGVISALTGRGDTIYEDRLNHASLIDAGLLSQASVKRYRHNDLHQLESLLSADQAKRKLVVVDGVFSMDGDLAPLPELSALCSKYQAQLMVDDAHGFGVLGKQGGGCAEHFKLTVEQLPILVGTLGKSFGSFGAFVAGSDALIETLIQVARTYIYTTALPPAVAAATSTTLTLLQEESWRRDKLNDVIRYFRQGAKKLGLPLIPLLPSQPMTPIQPILLGDDALVMSVAATLREQSILVGAIRPPTVPEGTARLRITLNVHHDQSDIDKLLDALANAIPATYLKSSMGET
ncbi:8-amino-7-oxononanoate synthase [Candidatus Endobugula sertula]|uniref:8-amino-7-oxononanoate synthase n=1 Tax=Candidatus Endobugula sertula TaxID=62101 RepID=A0A1D2QRR1_9GAMM|nr:8-amino-7-oxononanoate synthase [Candidatus Endobugula sertula]